MNTINPNDSKDALSKTPFKNFAIGVVVILIFLIGHSLFAQVGVGNTNPQAQLDISASNTASPTNLDGILIPRVTNLPADASMTANQDGMMVFYDNTGEDGKGFYYWDDTASDWIKIAVGSTSDADWHEEGTSSAPNNISDNMFTLGNVAIGANVNPNANLLVYSNSQTSGINLSRYYANTTASGAGGINSFTNIQNGSTGWYYNVGSSLQSTNDVTGTMYNYRAVNNMRSLSSSQSPHYLYYGLFSNNIGANVNAKRYGSYIEYSTNTTSLGDKYGHYTIIPSALSGTHYGFYSDVQNSSGYAAYLIGRTELGESTSNRYRMPASDGSVNQVIRTDGSGNLSFVNASAVFTDTDNQNLTAASLTGTTLNLGIQNGTGTSVNLVALQDGTGTDDQNIQNLSFNNSTNILTVGIENGTAQNVDLSALDDTGNDWSINGNSGTNPSTNFIGTTDNQDLAFRTNNVEKVRITAKGQIETTQLQSVWIGENAGNSVTSGTRNTFVGRISGASITTGNDNTAIGGLSLSSLSTGIDNTAIGLGALFDLQNGDGNTFVGEQSGENLATGSYNTVFGHLAGENMNGSSNIFIGYQAGRSTTGSNKLIIDNSNDGTNSFIYGEMDNEILRANAEVQVTRNSTGTISHLDLIETAANDGSRLRFSNSAETTNNWLLYGRADDTEADARFNLFFSSIAGGGGGNVIVVTGDGNVGIRRTPTTNELEVNGTASKATAGAWLANSDRRLKKNINTIDSELALNKLLNLRGVTYEWNDNQTGTERPKELQYGFIAQELMEVFPEKVTKDNLGFYQTSYGDYDAVFVQAIKELNKKIESLETENTILKYKLSRLEALEARLLAVEKSMNNVNTNTSVSHTADE
ncbi:tail fiber domain-containing protein [Winogradskyella sp. HB-48]|uniref:tail fiber domain-containing protein n=1 Tax=Winogradskyella sp. HB-48 TaxID=3416808 RepID=UPI003CF7E587